MHICVVNFLKGPDNHSEFSWNAQMLFLTQNSAGPVRGYSLVSV